MGEGADRIFLAALAEILLVCTAVLLFFAYLTLPIEIATAACVFVLFIGTLLCWKSTTASEAIMVIGLFGSQYILVSYFSQLLLPFLIFDVLVLFTMTRIWYGQHD
jgi:hypothetical protein